MSKIISTEVLIHAKPEKVWSILTNFDAYPKWNPFIKSIKGEVKAGNKLTVNIQPAGSKGMTFKPEVLKAEAQKEIRWLGHLLFAGIFDGEHQFRLKDNGNGTTTFIHREEFKGLLVPFLKKQLDNGTRSGFEAMNMKLKELAEQK